MIVTKRSMTLWLAIVALGMSGCAAPEGQVAPGPRAGEPDGARRFRDTPLEGRTAVESAIELSEKYAKLSDQTVILRQDNQRLTSENENLRRQVATLDVQLKQTQKELREANDLLIEMLTELNQWKSNILGFRTEMRDAARAQLEALLKVLEILGGEMEAGLLSQRHTDVLDPNVNTGNPIHRSESNVRR